MHCRAPSPSSGGAVMWCASRAHAEARQLAVDGRAARLRVLVFLEHHAAGAVAEHEAVAVAVPGTAGARRVVVARGQARAAQKPPRPSGVVAISAPPATITSASPYWMVRAAMPMLWVAVVHAVTSDRFGPVMP
jgi:hypothetical protein